MSSARRQFAIINAAGQRVTTVEADCEYRALLAFRRSRGGPTLRGCMWLEKTPKAPDRWTLMSFFMGCYTAEEVFKNAVKDSKELERVIEEQAKKNSEAMRKVIGFVMDGVKEG